MRKILNLILILFMLFGTVCADDFGIRGLVTNIITDTEVTTYTYITSAIIDINDSSTIGAYGIVDSTISVAPNVQVQYYFSYDKLKWGQPSTVADLLNMSTCMTPTFSSNTVTCNAPYMRLYIINHSTESCNGTIKLFRK